MNMLKAKKMSKTLVVALGILSSSPSLADTDVLSSSPSPADTGILSSSSSPVGTGGSNSSPDPYALYGHCSAGGMGSAFGMKAGHVYAVGETLTNVLAITVLQCIEFTGGGPTKKVSCPAGSPYAYCMNNDNDGVGHNITLGVLKLNATTNPNGNYTGCPSGAHLKSKLTLIKQAHRLVRKVKGIVTLACNATTQPPAPPKVVACPTPSPYSYCLETANDGSGNAVMIGVVTVQGAGDPYGLYGECNIPLALHGTKPGFLPKSSLVTVVGRSLDTVRSIDLIGCNAPVGYGGWFPTQLEVMDCNDAYLPPGLASHYDYCIVGTDTKGNGIIAGINK